MTGIEITQHEIPSSQEILHQGIIHLFCEQARLHPQRTALIFKTQQLTYAEVAEKVARLSERLSALGVGKGDHCVVMLNNSLEFALLMLAMAELGGVIAPLAASLAPNGIQTAIDSTDAKFLISTDAVIKKYQVSAFDNGLAETACFTFQATTAVTEENPQSLSQAIASIVACEYVLGQILSPEEAYGLDYILTMTSGSTGQPKPIVLSQKTKIHRSFDGARDLYELGDDEVIIAASPMYHSLAQRLVLLPLMTGGTAVILQGFNAKSWLEAIETHRVSFTLAVSSHLEQLLAQLKIDDQPRDLSSLQCLVSSSSLLRPELKAQCIEAFKCDFHECYGASEVGIVTNLSPRDIAQQSELLNTVGKALPYVRLKIVDNLKQELPTGQIGEIACQTTTAFSRYYKRPEATAESVIDDFFFTGDLGRVDEQGFLYLSGRKKELIIVGGTNVYPQDIESVLTKVNGILEVAVIGVEDAYFGEAILAVMAVSSDFVLRDAQKACMQQLADFQQPMAYEVVDALPRNAMGKLMKHELQKQFAGYDATKALRQLLSANK